MTDHKTLAVDWFEVIKKHRANGVFCKAQPLTPFLLVEEITRRLRLDSDTSVCVIYTVEWAIYLRLVAGVKDITVAVQDHDPVVEKLCAHWGFKYLKNILHMTNPPKFDVVVGNPPYQDETSNQKIYHRFYNKGLELCEPDGLLAFVTPLPMIKAIITGSFKGSVKVAPSKLQVVNYCRELKDKYFSSVGTSICYFVCQPSAGFIPSQSPTITVDAGTFYNTQIIRLLPQNYSEILINICRKIFSDTAKENPIIGSAISTKAVKSEAGDKVVKYIDKAGEFVTYYVNGGNAVDHAHYGLHRVFINQFGDRCKAVTDTSLLPSADRMIYTLVTPSLRASQNAEHILTTSTLIKFYQQVFAPRAPIVSFLYDVKKIDFDQVSTDQELYCYFGLTQEEINYIEEEIACHSDQ